MPGYPSLIMSTPKEFNGCESIKEVLKYHVYNSNIVGIMGTLLLWIFISLYVNFVSLKHSLFTFFVGALHRDYQFFETTSFYSPLHIRDESFYGVWIFSG